MADLYALLGVTIRASDAEIKAAYRRLAKKFHPDVNQNDAKVAAKFQEITAAYDILSDKDKRKKYDAGQIDDQGNPTHPFGAGAGSRGKGNPFSHAGFDFGGGSAGFSTDDFFSSIFGGMAGGKGTRFRTDQQPDHRGSDKSYTLKVGFLDAALGTTKQITLGNGDKVSLKIPAGTKSQDKLRLKGKGEPGLGQEGDAIIEIIVAEHPYFSREGLNIHLQLPITVYEAILGGKVAVPTIHGPLNLKIPPASQSGQMMRLKGKGIHAKSAIGDQLVKIQIMLPEEKNENLEAFMKKLAADNPYNPRNKFELS